MSKKNEIYENEINEEQDLIIGVVEEDDDEEIPEKEEGNFFIVDTEIEEEGFSQNLVPEKKKFNLFKRKGIVIPSAVIALLLVVSLVMSILFRNGTVPMPTFIANTGIFQGDDFRFFDGITINGIDVSGLSLYKARKVVEAGAKKSQKNRILTVNTEKGSFTLNAADFDYEVQDLSALDTAKAYCVSVLRGEAKKEKKDFSVQLTIAEGSINKMREAAAIISKEPVAAVFKGVTNGKIEFTEEENGYGVDETELLNAVKAFLFSSEARATVTVKIIPVAPEVPKSELQKKIVKLSTYTTKSTNSANGNHNMKKAVTMCSGSVIQPGEVWSFNARVGNSNLESAGWKKATVYIGGKLDYGVGGGLCQASSTIYYAALLANMGVVERHNHRWLVGYAKRGLDATIDYPGLDLKLKNNSPYPVYIEGYMIGKELTVNFYGYQSDEYDEIRLNSWETSRVPGKYYTVSATRTLWKDGKLVKTENLIGSKYSLEAQTWASDSSTSNSEEESSSSTSSSGSEPSQSEGPSQSEQPSNSTDSSGGDELPGADDSGSDGWQDDPELQQ